MPRLVNVRLSAKLGLAFGVVLALTAAIIAVSVRDIDRLQQAHERVAQEVVPRIIAAQKTQAAFADVHFAQTQMVLTDGSERADQVADMDVFKSSLEALRRTSDNGSLAGIDKSVEAFQRVDGELFDTVKRGDRQRAAHLVAAEADAAKRAAEDPLSEREREVLRLLALGHTNQEIAQQLFISVRTAETHRAHIMQKLRLSTRAELVRHALAHGLLDEQ
jgi:DNA-binding CsgD family transcriptional regulator